MVKFCTLYISLALGIILCTGSIQAKPHEANVPLLEDAIPFQCLLNIPMGISPAEVKTILAGCSGIAITDGDDVNITSTIDISEYKGQVIYTLNLSRYTEGSYWLDYLKFSFFQGKLHSISGEKTLDADVTKRILTEYEAKLGKSKIKKNLRGFMGNDFHIKSNVWNLSNKSITLDPYDGVPVQFIIQNDSISNIVNDIVKTYVEVEVYTYDGYDKKKKLNIRDWYSENPEQIEGFTTQCEGIGKIALKGKGKGLTFRIQCENGNTVFEKKDINVGSKSNTVLTNFPENCEEKVMRKEVDQDIYGALFYLIVLKNEHEIYKGEITRLDCME